MNQRIQLPSGPTEWVSPVVVVPKPDGDICIFVDIRKARKAIERERHPIPTIEDIMHDLNKFMVFSKLDLTWGLHQNVMQNKRPITTFITHHGLFQYKKIDVWNNLTSRKVSEDCQRCTDWLQRSCKHC